MPKVSVIIPTYNRAYYVTLAIDSVLRQTFTDYELIVIDDGSTDDTKENLKRYGDKIKYIYQDNSGVSGARNTGIKYSCGQWLAFLDSDDEWDSNYLSKQMDRADKIPGLCMQMTDSCIIGLDGRRDTYFSLNRCLAAFKSEDYLLIKKPFRFVISHRPWQIGSTIILTETIIKSELFDTRLSISEDLDLISRLARMGSLGLIKDKLVNIFRRDESINCLTHQVKEDPIHAREINEMIYKNLTQSESLTYGERRTLNIIMCANRRALGNLLQQNADINGAREWYKRALFSDLSMASLGRYILSFSPLMRNLWNRFHG